MGTTDVIDRLLGHYDPANPTSGRPTRIWAADVVAVNQDGTVDCQPVMGRSTKVSVLVVLGPAPKLHDRVLVTDLNGDPQTPIVIHRLAATPPSVTGSRGGNAALASLLGALAAQQIIVDNTTA